LKHGGYITLLRRPGFLFFLITQFLGAMNDNVYRLVVSLILVSNSMHGGGVSLTAVVFLVPPILFSGYAGSFADKYSKRNVLIITKSFEVVSMLLAFWALGTEYTFLMLAVLFTLSTQNTFFSPAKYAIVPELVRRKYLSQANALLEMSTYVAIILGSAMAGILMQIFKKDTALISLVMIGIALLGTATSFGIPKVEAKDTQRVMHPNPYKEIHEGLKLLKGHLFLSLVVIGICYFWGIAILFQLNLLVFASNTLHLDYLAVGLMQTVLALGIGAGALLAGKLSGDRIEYGLIPLGLLGMSLGTIAMFWAGSSLWLTYGLLIFTSVFTGLYILPLKALQQDMPDKAVKGRLIATTNVFSNVAMIGASVTLWFMQEALQISPPTIFLIFGLITLVLGALAIYMLPAFFIRLILWVVMHTLYRVRVFNENNLPPTGPALLVCNHVSYIDSLVLSAVVPRFIRYLVHQRYYDIKMIRWIIQIANSIPIDTSDEAKVESSLKEAREALEQGHIVCVFAEGRITRTGNLLPFKRGFEKITQGLDVPIIPVHLDKLWDSIFSFRGGKFFWKFPRRIPVDVSVSFGAPMPASSNAWEVRQCVQELGSEAEVRAQTSKDILGLHILHSMRFHPGELCMADNHGDKESYGSFISKALWMSKQIRTRYADQNMIGVLLPPSVKGALVHVACVLAGKTVVNLPYHEKGAKIGDAIEACQVERVITTGTFLDGLGVAESPAFDHLAHWYEPPTWDEMILTRLAAIFLPARWILEIYGDPNQQPEDPISVLWSMETDRLHKPVTLSHRSILTPVASFRQIFDNLSNADCVAGVMPFYSPLGLLGTLWLPLLDGMTVVYHTRAKHDPKGVGELIREHKATILFDVPYGYQLYFKNIRPEDFSYVHYAIVGGLPEGEEFDPEFLQAFCDRFGLDLLEGYGNTETGPVSMNIPNLRMPGQLQMGFKRGSAGQPLPYVSVKVVDPQTHVPLEQGEVGLLLVKTPFRMIGYLNDPEATDKFFEDGWYNTGDLALIDEEGFLFFPHIL
jgi:acyl-[acyl-carrier-protein]-phospholipid O-acyltransferase/long-chain-fatty-acid--[acyl-carrier-protein] ligase